MTEQKEPPVPNSSGTAKPKLAAPADACDCHMHIYDGKRFPPPRPQSRMQANACVADYRLLQQRIGTSRTVVVSPAAYGTDNRVTLDAIAQLGNARGVAVVHPTIADAELEAFAASVADLTFLPVLRRVLRRNVKSKATLES
jgi:D-galactarolactone isomerase